MSTIAAINQNRWPDYSVILIVTIGIIVPNFLTAHIIQLVFGVYLRWLPAGGFVNGSVWHLVMPVTILAWPHAAPR